MEDEEFVAGHLDTGFIESSQRKARTGNDRSLNRQPVRTASRRHCSYCCELCEFAAANCSIFG